jgi:alcohol dehydrogenase (NADP+)
VLAVRNVAAARLIAAGNPRFVVLDAPLDLSELGSVRAYVAALTAWLGPRRIASLVLNAGIGGSLPIVLNSSGYEKIWATNHLGHFLLTILLAPTLSVSARVIVVASEVHDPALGAGPFPDPSASWPTSADAYDAAFPRGGATDALAGNRRYCRSKLLNVLFAQELAARAPGLAVASFNPGLMLDTAFVRGIAGAFIGALAWAAQPLLRCTRFASILREAPRSGAALAQLAAPPPEDVSLRGAYFSTTADGKPLIVPASAFARSPSGAAAGRDIWRHSERWSGLSAAEIDAASASFASASSSQIQIHKGICLGNGLTLPVLGFGTWRCDVNLLRGAVADAIRIGYRHIDSGPYKNEAIVGAGIADAIAAGSIRSRSELWITGKLPTTAMDPSAVEPTLRKLLADLNVDYVDCYMTHWPYAIDPQNTASPPAPEFRRGYSPEAYLSTWRAMEACVDKGLARTLGASNMTPAKLRALAAAGTKYAPSLVQNELHPALASRALAAYCATNGIALCGYSPLGSPGRPDLYRSDGDPDVLTLPAVVAAAAETGRTPAQVVLRWAVQRGTVPLPRTTTLSRIAENADVFTWSLTFAQMAAIDAHDLTANSKGRIMKGDNFAPPGVDWHDIWDEEGDGKASTP